MIKGEFAQSKCKKITLRSISEPQKVKNYFTDLPINSFCLLDVVEIPQVVKSTFVKELHELKNGLVN